MQAAIKKYTNNALKITAYLVVVAAVFFIFFQLSSDSGRIDPQASQKNIEQYRGALYEKLHTLEKTEGKKSLQVNLFRLISCNVIGEICTENPSDGDKNFNSSLIGSLTNFMVVPYTNPPASFAYWVGDTLNNAGLVPDTYAAEGIGFASLKPFSNIWKLFRDIAYLILVLILITIGFMIMFRMKLNPQTVISIESALPRIVISLILITFSFPIAGFLIDLMYVVIALAISLLSKNTIITIDSAEYQNRIFAGGHFLFDTIIKDGNYKGVGQALLGILPSILSNTVRTIVAVILYYGALKFGPTSGIVDGSALQQIPVLGGVAKVVLALIIALILLPILFFLVPAVLSLMALLTACLLYFKILFMLFTTYLNILLMIIFSPLVLLFEAFPGRSTFTTWFKNLSVNLLVFPTVVVLLIVSSMIVSLPAAEGKFWQTPFLYGINPQAFGVLVGVGIMFLIPQLIKLMKEALGVQGMPINVGVGTFLGGGGAAIGAGLGVATGVPSLLHGLPYGVQQKLRKFKPAGGIMKSLLGPEQEELYKQMGEAAGAAAARGAGINPAQQGQGNNP